MADLLVKQFVIKMGRLIVLDVFFFQAEAGIRDATVTVVQTCALPISPECTGHHPRGGSSMDRDVTLAIVAIVPQLIVLAVLVIVGVRYREPIGRALGSRVTSVSVLG